MCITLSPFLQENDDTGLIYFHYFLASTSQPTSVEFTQTMVTKSTRPGINFDVDVFSELMLTNNRLVVLQIHNFIVNLILKEFTKSQAQLFNTIS